MIHATAIVHPKAKLAEGVTVGAFSIIGEQVELGEACSVGAHVVIEGRTRIGARNRIFHFAAIGGQPQDKKYAGEDTALEIGDDNTIREYVTISCGTAQDVGVTRLGNDNWIMAYTHIAHDCQVGSHAILANLTQLAGHVRVDDWAILGGGSLVHQFVHIGAHSFVGVGTRLTQDLPPYVTVSGAEPKPYGINSEGLRRRGYSAQAIDEIKRAYRTLYRSGLSLDDAKRELAAQAESCPEVIPLIEFLRDSNRGIVR
ncbi:MAG: acyl-ACP--UDP-N-acetylglucosamine O-acyltransferase [Betaproteobacteria bacterium]|nr:acyl-ACP--UDP-N-acetylglucosamine O-acyltransferase [Betaproteobacteria bacterium]